VAFALLAALALAAAPSARAVDTRKAAAATTPAKPAAPDPKSIAAVNAAAAALVKEAQAAFKEKEPKLRDKSDYFGAMPPPEITPEAVAAVLEKPIYSDRRIDCYVKWQLLSGVPGKFPDELAPKVIAIYRRAPEPLSHPGLDRAQLQSHLFRVGITKKEKVEEVNSEFKPAVERNAADNLYILRYRTSLFMHLPTSGDAFMAGLADVYTRVQHGVGAKDVWDALAGSLQGWSLTADAPQRNAVSGALTQLLAAARDARNKPYVRVEWNGEGKTPGMVWHEEPPIAEKTIQDQIDVLRQAAQLMESTGFKDKK
jgi:hypothetical protein